MAPTFTPPPNCLVFVSVSVAAERRRTASCASFQPRQPCHVTPLHSSHVPPSTVLSSLSSCIPSVCQARAVPCFVACAGNVLGGGRGDSRSRSAGPLSSAVGRRHPCGAVCPGIRESVDAVDHLVS